MKGQNFASRVLSRHTFRISRKKGSDFFYHRGTLKDSSRYSCASDTIIFVKRSRDPGKRGKTYFTVIVPITKSFNGFFLNVPTDFRLLWKALLTVFAQRSSLVIGPRVVQLRSSRTRNFK